MRQFNADTDMTLVDDTIICAYDFGTGILTAVKEGLQMNDIAEPPKLDNLVFDRLNELSKLGKI